LDRTSDYVLALNPAEVERLQVQAHVWEPDVEALLDQIGVQPGWSCLDVGCGAVGILKPLSQRVGPAGHVVGIDNDPRLLAAARAYIEVEGLTNVELLERNALDTGLPRESFDLVHARFLLVFGQWDALLREMIALAKPDGIVASQETDQNSWNFLPEGSTWSRLKQTLEAAFHHIGGDANLGRRTAQLLSQAGLEAVQVRAAVRALQDSHPYMRMPILGAQGFRNVITSAGLMNEVELNDTLAQMERIVDDPETIALTFTVMPVWGRKQHPPA
jgi:ubiquinone/menaquinone biosynthesis C-methylase UbiE